MKQIFFFLSILFLGSCSSEDSSSENPDCDFVGKWCTESPFSANTCWTLGGITLEFREDGELVQNGTTFFTWKSTDCQLIDIHHNATGDKVQEYTIISLDGDRMTINIGAETDLIRTN